MEKRLVLSPRHKKLVQFLRQQSPKYTTPPVIIRRVGGSPNVIYKDLKDLARAGYLSCRSTGIKNGVEYAIKAARDWDNNKAPTSSISHKDLLTVLSRFASDSEYITKVQQFAWKFPHAVARVYSLGCRELTGEKLSQEELEAPQQLIIGLHSVVQAYAGVLESFILAEELWEPTTRSKLLFSDTPQVILEPLIKKLLENWENHAESTRD